MIAAVQPIQKRVLKDAAEARKALAMDKLGVVYRKATEVFVVTAFGSGKFTPQEWDS